MTRTILHLLKEDDHEAEHQYSHRNAIQCFLQTETFTQDTPVIFSCPIWQTYSMALEFAFRSAEHREVSFSAFQRELLSERKTNDFINGRYYRILDLSQGLSDYDH